MLLYLFLWRKVLPWVWLQDTWKVKTTNYRSHLLLCYMNLHTRVITVNKSGHLLLHTKLTHTHTLTFIQGSLSHSLDKDRLPVAQVLVKLTLSLLTHIYTSAHTHTHTHHCNLCPSGQDLNSSSSHPSDSLFSLFLLLKESHSQAVNSEQIDKSMGWGGCEGIYGLLPLRSPVLSKPRDRRGRKMSQHCWWTETRPPHWIKPK